jgi:uncharacterized protein YdaU (DUF1376 family)
MTDYPFMPVDVAIIMADTVGLSTEEYGAYRLLLDAMWLHRGWLPDDDRELRRICRLTPFRWSRVRPRLEPLLMVEKAKGLISQKRLLKERAKISHRTMHSSEANISPKFSATSGKNNGLGHANATRAGAKKTITIKKKKKEKEGGTVGVALPSLGLEGRSVAPPSPEETLTAEEIATIKERLSWAH